MAVKLTEIIIGEHVVRHRDRKDLSRWLDDIRSVLFPVSFKAEASMDGEWRDCIVSGRLSDEGPEKICLTLFFPDTTTYTAKGKRNSFYTPEYNEAVEKERQARKGKNAKPVPA